MRDDLQILQNNHSRSQNQARNDCCHRHSRRPARTKSSTNTMKPPRKQVSSTSFFEKVYKHERQSVAMSRDDTYLSQTSQLTVSFFLILVLTYNASIESIETVYINGCSIFKSVYNGFAPEFSTSSSQNSVNILLIRAVRRWSCSGAVSKV